MSHPLESPAVNESAMMAGMVQHMLLAMQRKCGDLARQSPRTIWALLVSVAKLIWNPLNLTYHSQNAYLCGDIAVKYVLVPDASAAWFPMPNPFDKDYLRHR